MSSVLTNILAVGAGSCLGGVARYLVGRALPVVCHVTFPWATFIVNILGCFIIGLACGWIEKGGQMSDTLRLFLTVGFCGGFTTFSTFMHENYTLLSTSRYITLALYAAASILTGFAAIYLAYHLTRQ